MQRRTLMLAGALLVALPGLGRGQSSQRTVRIGVLAGDMIAPHEEEELLSGLREQGLVEGRNLIIERRYADGRLDMVAGFAREIAGMKLDAVVATGTPTTLIAQQALGSTPDSTPIVMAAASRAGAAAGVAWYATGEVLTHSPRRGALRPAHGCARVRRRTGARGSSPASPCAGWRRAAPRGAAGSPSTGS
jgi:ABC-type uncharacterized transport system substrate-binding protein